MTDIVKAVAQEIARKVFVTVPEAMPAAQAAIAAMQPYIDAARIEGATMMREAAAIIADDFWFAETVPQRIRTLDPAAVCKEK